MDHTGIVYLMDKRGKFVSAFNLKNGGPERDMKGPLIELKQIRDQGLLLEVAMWMAKDIENERKACEIRIRSDRRAGQLLKDMEKAKGGQPYNKGSESYRSHDATGSYSERPKP